MRAEMKHEAFHYGAANDCGGISTWVIPASACVWIGSVLFDFGPPSTLIYAVCGSISFELLLSFMQYGSCVSNSMLFTDPVAASIFPGAVFGLIDCNALSSIFSDVG